MGIKHFNISVLIRLFLIIAVAACIGYMLPRNWFFSVALFLVLVILVVNLLYLFGQSNRNVTYFFDAIRNSDTSFSFPTKTGNTSLAVLHDRMNTLNRHFQNIRIQSEYREKYYQMLLQQSVVGLVVLNAANEVEFMNNVACDFAGVPTDSSNKNLFRIKNPEFFEHVSRLKAGDTLTHRIVTREGDKLLFIRVNEIRNPGGRIRMISLHDIKQQLEENELESWQKLIRILNHEIMNSIAPITSISKTLTKLYYHENEPMKASELDEDIVSNTVQGLKIIEEQSTGLLNFVNNYRRLTKIPMPVIAPFDVNEWMDQVKILFYEKMAANQITFTVTVEKNVSVLTADKNLVNQVVVNILNNAVEAFTCESGDKRISVEVSCSRQKKTTIRIRNNGPRIQPDILEKIFFPFYTTKENGSGIGLSLSRQIIQLHRGSISVESNAGSTSFIIQL